MPDTYDDEPIDTLLREALAARPEPRTEVDFAARVLATVAAPELPRVPAVWPVWAAITSVVAMITLAAWRLAATSSWQSADASLQQAATSNSGSLLPIGGALFLLAVVWVIARSALSDGDGVDTARFG